jgi:hypothetical protein
MNRVTSSFPNISLNIHCAQNIFHEPFLRKPTKDYLNFTHGHAVSFEKIFDVMSIRTLEGKIFYDSVQCA